MSRYVKISKFDKIINSRDVIARIEELESEATDTRLDEDTEELTNLLEFARQGANYSREWLRGVELINGDHFEDFAEEHANSIGAIRSDEHSWPYGCIDWKRAAEELRTDYSAIDFDGEEFWLR